MSHQWLPLKDVLALEPYAAAQGVSAVARSSKGFVRAYERAGGKIWNMEEFWPKKREGFIKRHRAQAFNAGEQGWEDGQPSRRTLALAMWAYASNPDRLRRWLAEQPRKNPSVQSEVEFFHITRTSNRRSILKHGLKSGTGWEGGPGVYVTTEPDSWLHLFEPDGVYKAKQVDIWSVDVTGYELKPDEHPTAEGLDEDFVVPHSIPPERLNLVDHLSRKGEMDWETSQPAENPRPIPLDREKLLAAVRSLGEQAHRTIEREERLFAKNWVLGHYHIETTDVAGNPHRIGIWLVTRPSRGWFDGTTGSFSRSADRITIEVPVDEARDYNMMLQHTGSSDWGEVNLMHTLLHEFTHARDVYAETESAKQSLMRKRRDTPEQDEDAEKKSAREKAWRVSYLNQPIEVRARMQELADIAVRSIPEIMRTYRKTNRPSIPATQWVLEQMSLWQEIEPDLTPSSRKKIMLGVERSLRDAGLKDIEVTSDIEDAVEYYVTSFITEPDGRICFEASQKTMSIENILQWDDYSSWGEIKPGDLVGLSKEEITAELKSYRGAEWAKMAMQWVESGVFPPITLIRGKASSAMADGRGRVNIAVGLNLKSMDVIILTESDKGSMCFDYEDWTIRKERSRPRPRRNPRLVPLPETALNEAVDRIVAKLKTYARATRHKTGAPGYMFTETIHLGMAGHPGYQRDVDILVVGEEGQTGRRTFVREGEYFKNRIKIEVMVDRLRRYFGQDEDNHSKEMQLRTEVMNLVSHESTHAADYLRKGDYVQKRDETFFHAWVNDPAEIRAEARLIWEELVPNLEWLYALYEDERKHGKPVEPLVLAVLKETSEYRKIDKEMTEGSRRRLVQIIERALRDKGLDTSGSGTLNPAGSPYTKTTAPDGTVWETFLDEGTRGWQPSEGTLTRRDSGWIDPKLMVILPGCSNEELLFLKRPSGRQSPQKFASLVRSIRKNGFRDINPLQIAVQADGKVCLWEGNHRARAAIKAGAPKVPVWIEYFANSQKSGLIFDPKTGIWTGRQVRTNPARNPESWMKRGDEKSLLLIVHPSAIGEYSRHMQNDKLTSGLVMRIRDRIIAWRGPVLILDEINYRQEPGAEMARPIIDAAMKHPATFITHNLKEDDFDVITPYLRAWRKEGGTRILLGGLWASEDFETGCVSSCRDIVHGIKVPVDVDFSISGMESDKVMGNPARKASFEVTSDIEDAVEYYLMQDRGTEPEGTVHFLPTTKRMPVQEILGWDDYSSWGGFPRGELVGLGADELRGELNSFRRGWADRAMGWLKAGLIPPVILVDARKSRMIGDGRGRTSLAVGMNIPELDVVILKQCSYKTPGALKFEWKDWNVVRKHARRNPARKPPNLPGLELVEVTEGGVTFATGRPARIQYIRNTQPSPYLGAKFQQDIETAGRYLLHLSYDPGDLARGWEVGDVDLKSPLVLRFTTDGRDAPTLYGPGSWKSRLHKVFKAKGCALTRALRKAGYDSIVTVWVQDGFPQDTREIVLLPEHCESRRRR